MTPVIDPSRYPALAHLIARFDGYLKRAHPQFFSPAATHPVLSLKRSKVIHDALWGTNRFSWRELLIIDTPLLQRLRDIQQLGLAHFVYPSARHTRFEHSLGVVTVASRIFDAIHHRQPQSLRDIIRALFPKDKSDSGKIHEHILRIKQELRLAALLHDCGHSLFSHASEKAYSELSITQSAVDELSQIVGMEKGAGEALSFCLALTESVRALIDRSAPKLIGSPSDDEYDGPIDFLNIALIIVGRAHHPFLQFLGDIISSTLDADKLDYLMRDAVCSGLPLRYDLDMYLSSILLHKEFVADDETQLESLYTSSGNTSAPTRIGAGIAGPYPGYDAYRLRLPLKATHVFEQVVISKFMLFNYLYNHHKVRSGEGLLDQMLKRLIRLLRIAGQSDETILELFLDMNDASLVTIPHQCSDTYITDHCYRLLHRLLPRRVYGVTKRDATHAAGAILATFFNDLDDREKRPLILSELRQKIGEALLAQGIKATDPEEAVLTTGVLVDLARKPNFEDLDDILCGEDGRSGDLAARDAFPVGNWVQAWATYRTPIRIFAFSEHVSVVERAAEKALKAILTVEDSGFYDSIRTTRG